MATKASYGSPRPFQPGWVWQPPRRDFGKDGLIVVRDESKLHNLEFSVQIKTSMSPRIRGGEVLLSGVSRASIQYWFASPLPTLIIAVDLTNVRGGTHGISIFSTHQRNYLRKRAKR
ncbi:MAG: DUF4365 domain-containing protein [Acidobacteria bacterium]|nr:DUF4365 domain-containing protein [Acidobacteriota bacterium]